MHKADKYGTACVWSLRAALPTTRGETTVPLERGTTTLVIEGVPAEVCENCGEAYVDELRFEVGRDP